MDALWWIEKDMGREEREPILQLTGIMGEDFTE